MRSCYSIAHLLCSADHDEDGGSPAALEDEVARLPRDVAEAEPEGELAIERAPEVDPESEKPQIDPCARLGFILLLLLILFVI